jgi:hypothetical protein
MAIAMAIAQVARQKNNFFVYIFEKYRKNYQNLLTFISINDIIF